MEIPVHRKSLPPLTECSSQTNQAQAKECTYGCRGITALPRELVVKILINLGGRDLVVCKRVTREWQDIIDSSPMLPRVFYRRLHPLAPVSESLATVQDHYGSIRPWLGRFGEPGRKLVVELDKLALAGARFFPEILFFSLARVLAETSVFHCHKVCTIEHSDEVRKANFSPDGRYMVTASRDKTAKVCGHVDGQWRELTTLVHPDIVHSVYFSPTGAATGHARKHYCVTHCVNQTIHIWEVPEQTVEPWTRQVTLPHCGLLRPPSFSADGNYLVTLPAAHTTHIHQLVDEQWQRQTTLDGHSVYDVCFHPQDNILATLRDSVNVHIWQLVDYQWIHKVILPHPPGYVTRIHFSPNGNRLLVNTVKFMPPGRYQAIVYIYNRAGETWPQEATIPVAKTVETTRFSPNGAKLVMMSLLEDVIAIWSFFDNRWQPVILPGAATFTNSRFSPDGDRLVTTTKDNTAIIWREAYGQWQEEATFYLGADRTNVSRDSVFSPYGHYLVTMPVKEDAKIWGIVNGTWQQKSYPPLGRVRKGTFSPDGLYFLAYSWNNTAHIWTFQQEPCQQGPSK